MNEIARDIRSEGALQPRISWDRTHNYLRALPGGDVFYGISIPLR